MTKILVNLPETTNKKLNLLKVTLEKNNKEDTIIEIINKVDPTAKTTENKFKFIATKY